MMKKIILFSLLFLPLLVSASSFEQNWSALLKDYVKQGEIDGIGLSGLDYLSVRKDFRYNEALKALETAPIPTSRNGKMAFWINAYNILAVKVVLDKYPIKSIKDAGGWFNKVWDVEVAEVAGKPMTLNQIEHEILRKMGDPRIHAAIVCASVSCPDLRAEAFTEAKLDVQLEEQMLMFLSNSQKGARVDTFGRKIYLSKIFDWFGEDFTTNGRSIIEALELYLPADPAGLINKNTTVEYMDYDWTLNDSLRF